MSRQRQQRKESPGRLHFCHFPLYFCRDKRLILVLSTNSYLLFQAFAERRMRAKYRAGNAKPLL